MNNSNRNKRYYLRRQQRMKDVPNTLSENQRELVLDTFNRKCALTEEHQDVDLDHFVPLAWGKKVIKYNIGGTTYENMIPFHTSINRSKNSNNPFLWFERCGERHGISRDKWDSAVEYIANNHGLSSIEYENRVNACYSEIRAERWMEDFNSMVIREINMVTNIKSYLSPHIICALRKNLNIPVVVELFGSTLTRQLFND